VWCALVKVKEKEADLSIRQIGVNKNRWGWSSFYLLFPLGSGGSRSDSILAAKGKMILYLPE